MSQPALWLAPAMMIASGSIHAVVNAILKGGKDKMAGRAMIDGSSAVILLPATLFVPLPHGAWGWLAASAAIHCLYLYALVRAFETSDFSAAYPIMRGAAPLLTAILAIGLFGEAASTGELAGIAVIGLAVAALVFGRHIGRAGVGWALLTAAMIGCYTVTDANGVRAAPVPASYIVWSFVASGTAIVTLFGLISRGRIFSAARAQWRPGVVAGALSIVTYGLALYAFSLGPTAPLAALRETGMITALLISALFLHERVTRLRAFSVFGIFAGAVMILSL
ncbi:DMT family transporter [Sphingomonas sp. G-3-2-10]|uniref:DMT family transporter n=1 Tax=Sphingomonas sp. G-3-2-10 TaxID=2728838 RepID=UPI00146F5711|nr:DMT family transporter [Sphingomonas sp. G-3-2-10]NML07670.1 EamA family transporter [Sphingomonas sp. G-3-2-10]